MPVALLSNIAGNSPRRVPRAPHIRAFCECVGFRGYNPLCLRE
jgi:hypothetical protein